MTDTGEDVLHGLTNDHRELRARFRRLVEIPPGDAERKRLVDELTVELVRHLVLEEEYLYPAVRRYLNDGDRLVAEAVASHRGITDVLRELEGHHTHDSDFDQLVTVLHNEMTAHIDEEEHQVFTRLRRHCPEERRIELGERLREAKASAERDAPAGPASEAGRATGTGLRQGSGTGPASGPGLVDRARASVGGVDHRPGHG